MKAKISDLKYRINNLIPKKICNYFIDVFEKNKKFSDHESSYKNIEKKIIEDNFTCLNLTQASMHLNELKQPLDIAKKYISIMIVNYVEHIKKEISPTVCNVYMKSSPNIRILKYGVGQNIKDHTDVGPNFRASCTLNLNEDYEGGEFRFFNGQIKESFKTGDAMIFPAEPIWVHGTEPITKGTRYSINCFLQNHEPNKTSNEFII
tara:strand:+ start:1287 stop:1904 length:618 start_codon:yes stop_codon:yes gene_type:complete